MRRALALLLALSLPASAAEIPRLPPVETPVAPPASAAVPGTSAALAPQVFQTPLLLAAAGIQAPSAAALPAALPAATPEARAAFDAFTAQPPRASEQEKAGNVVSSFFEHSTLDHAVGPAPVVPATPGAPKDDAARLKSFKRGMAVAGAFVAVELAGSFLGHSASLRADALHSAVDVAINSIGLLAIALARRHPDGGRWKKAEPAVGLASAALVALTAYELGKIALERFVSPVPISGLTTALFALFGIGSHLAPALALYRHRKDGVGTEGVFLHAMTDAVGSFAVAAGGLASWALGYGWIDPAVTALVTLMVAHAAWDLGARSWKALRPPRR